MKLRHLSVSFALLACAALSLPAPSSADEVKWPRRLVISVPASGNVVHMIVTALGKTIEEHTPVERVIVQPIGGINNFAPMMEKGEVDIAIHSGADVLAHMARRLFEAKGWPLPEPMPELPHQRAGYDVTLRELSAR